MSNLLKSITCQRCGSGFVLTETYVDLLERRGDKVLVPILCPTCFLAHGPLAKQSGKVKWFNPRNRYGFIANNDGEEFFFHQQQVMEDSGRALREGQAVRFHLRYARKGPEALNVELVP